MGQVNEKLDYEAICKYYKERLAWQKGVGMAYLTCITRNVWLNVLDST